MLACLFGDFVFDVEVLNALEAFFVTVVVFLDTIKV